MRKGDRKRRTKCQDADRDCRVRLASPDKSTVPNWSVLPAKVCTKWAAFGVGALVPQGEINRIRKLMRERRIAAGATGANFSFFSKRSQISRASGKKSSRRTMLEPLSAPKSARKPLSGGSCSSLTGAASVPVKAMDELERLQRRRQIRQMIP